MVEQAAGTVLAHDLTQIIPGEYKGARYKKGYVIQEEDIPVQYPSDRLFRDLSIPVQ